MMGKQYVLGIDFGTTTLSGAIVDVTTRKAVTANVETKADFPLGDEMAREQSLERLESCLYEVLDHLLPSDGLAILAIGLTGQMHGVVGLDAAGQAVTNVVTWQDHRGDSVLADGKTLLEDMRTRSPGLHVANGYGLTTLYRWLAVEKNPRIVTFCTLPDYFGMRLTGNRTPLIDPSMAHSIGGYDVLGGHWDSDAIARLDLQDLAFPKVTGAPHLRGNVTDRRILAKSLNKMIGVTVALGDNQASVLATVRDLRKSLLVNIGTGSQISHAIRRSEIGAFVDVIDGVDTELRPLVGDMLLMATCLTSGGVVYKCVHDFFAACGKELFGLDTEQLGGDLWAKMEACAAQTADSSELHVSPEFDGARSKPAARGRIDNIGLTNFTPANLIQATLGGIAEYHRSFVPSKILERIENLYGSGNGLKKNAALRQAIENAFGRELLLSEYDEEAAVGAAIFAASACPAIEHK
jgi:sedoheptulokinase